MSEMIERVAKALASEHPNLLYLADARLVAETVKTAIREPTEAQLIAARDWSAARYGKPIGDDAAIGCWQAMIGAI